MGDVEILQKGIEIVIIIIVVVFSATIHEIAHGWVAYREGDPTAKFQNRLTLNPLAHIDPFMSIIMPILFYLSAGFIFGGAKPVPVNPFYFRNGRQSYILVSAAGPGSNLIMAVIGAIIFRVVITMSGVPGFAIVGQGLVFLLVSFVQINLVLFLFNLLPIPPLDGSKILEGLLPSRYESFFRKVEPYGMFIIIALLFTNILSVTLFPLLRALFAILLGI